VTHKQKCPSNDASRKGQLVREMIVAHVHASQVGDKRWQERANCLGVDPDLFFPERGASTREAKSVCGSCEVRLDCLEYALVNGEKFGIWGGLSERERRRLRRQRALARRAAASA
jgi:WhiB family transcriptional regulator, redox-sensing transcriptional regulator